MYIIPDDLEDYCISHSEQVPDYLQELERATHLRTLAPQMLSGSLMGRYLSFVSTLLRPDCIVEIGTFTGYGSLCLAEGLSKTGTLHTFEVNDELLPTIEEFQLKSPFRNQIEVHLGKAEDLLPGMDIQPALAFLDAGKLQYEQHFEILMQKMTTGGVILVDNVLWSGKVIKDVHDDDTVALRAFNDRITTDERIKKIMLPIRDGLTMIRIL